MCYVFLVKCMVCILMLANRGCDSLTELFLVCLSMFSWCAILWVEFL